MPSPSSSLSRRPSHARPTSPANISRPNLHRWLPRIGCLLLPLAVACASASYQPVSERSFENLVAEGCGREGVRITTTAKINRVYEDSVMLWDGADPETVVSMRVREAGLGARTKGLVTKTRFERGYEELKGLEKRDWPVTVTATCRGGDVPPVVTRFSYRNADNERREIELGD